MIYILSVHHDQTVTMVESAASQATYASPFVQREGRSLVLNGKPFKSVGVNRYNLLTRGGTPYIGCAGVFSDSDLVAWFGEVKAMGATSVRLWLFQSFVADGDFTRFDRVLSLAEANNIKVIPVLENQWQDCTEGGYKNSEWYREGYKLPYGTYTMSYKEHVGKMVARYKNNPTILLWQLINEAEAEHLALYAFAEDISSYIKSIDRNHLVSLGTIGSGQLGAQESQYRVLHAIPTIDVVEYHDYHAELSAFPAYDNYNSLKVRFSDAITLDKPIIMGEAGIKVDCAESDCYTRQVRANLFAAKLYEFFSRGGAAYLLWSYRDHPGASYDKHNFSASDPLYQAVLKQSQSLE